MLSFFRKVNPDAEAGKARRALQAGRPDEAAAICQAALKARPGHAESHALLGRAYEKLGRVGEAIEAYEAACANAPSYANLLAAAQLYVQVADWERAEEKFQAAIGLFPTAVSAWKGLAEARRRLGKVDRIVQCHDMVVSLRPDDLEARLDLAEACAEAGEIPKAHDISKSILEGEPANRRALHCLANCFAARHEWGEAIGVYERLLALREAGDDAGAGETARIHYDLAVALRHIGSDDDALPHLQACEELQPTFLPVYRDLAEIYQAQGDPGNAIAATRRALALQPSEPAIWRDLGKLHLAGGEPRAALEAFATALKHKPGHTEAIAGTAEALSAAGRHERAKAICVKLILNRSFQALPHLVYARVLRNAGELEEALRQITTALAIAPADPEIQRFRDGLLKALDGDSAPQ